MSELAKRIGRVQRREVSGGMGFAPAKREAPRAMLLAARAKDGKSAKAALDAGADIVLMEGADAKAAKSAVSGLDKACLGVVVNDLDEALADGLREAGVDFIVSPLASTASAAVDTEKSGHVIAAGFDIGDSTLRSLGPLGFDALFVEGEASAPTLAGQLELVRLASFSGLPLVVNVEAAATVAHLRVLRDSGAVMALAPDGASPGDLKKLAEALAAVPAPRRSGKGSDIALVPSAAAHAHEDDDEVEDPE